MLRLAVALGSFVVLSMLGGACSKSGEGPSSSRDDSGAPLGDAGANDAGEIDGAWEGGACTSPAFSGSPLSVQCNQLVDSEGRDVLLHGVNARVEGLFDVTFTDGRLPLQTIPVFTQSDATQIRATGFNALRLGVNWSAIEPTETSGYQASYLDAMAAVTQMCASAGVYVLIDFHQDSYSKEIGEDGAPLWAIIPTPTKLLGGPLQPNLFDTPQVQDAYSTFFGEADAGDGPEAGTFLRSRLAQMEAAVATRFAADPAVVGFELYNEPWGDDQHVWAFDAEMIPAVRAAAPQKLIFFEPPAIRNELDTATHGMGSIGAGTVYAPHVYTLAFSNENVTGLTEQNFANSNVNARAEANSCAAPLVITEYGWDPSSPNFDNWAQWQSDLEDQNLASSFFWLWKEVGSGSWGFFDMDDAGITGVERPATIQAMTRARLEAVAGSLVGVSYDPTAHSIEARYVGASGVTAPNIVSVGAAAVAPASQWKATCDGTAVATNGSDPLQIPCSGPGEHVLVVAAP